MCAGLYGLAGKRTQRPREGAGTLSAAVSIRTSTEGLTESYILQGQRVSEHMLQR